MILSTSRELWFYFSLLLECGTFSSFLQAWVSFKVPARRPFPKHLRWLLCYAFQKAVPSELRKSRVAGFLFAWAWVCPGDHWGGSSDTGVRVWRMPRPQGSLWTLCHIPHLLCHQQPGSFPGTVIVFYPSWCFFRISVLWLVYGSYSTELLIDCWQQSMQFNPCFVLYTHRKIISRCGAFQIQSSTLTLYSTQSRNIGKCLDSFLAL